MRTKDIQHQDSNTRQLAFKLLRDGNERFVNNLKLIRNILKKVYDTPPGQGPFGVILSCIESSTCAKLILYPRHRGILSMSTAGDIINENIAKSKFLHTNQNP